MSKHFFLYTLMTIGIHCSGLCHEQLTKADAYFDATLFDQAEPIYASILEDSSFLNLKEKKYARKQLVKCRLFQNNFEGVISVLSDTSYQQKLEWSEENLEDLFFLGISHSKLGNSCEAIELFEMYLQNPPKNLSIYNDEAWFELGLAYFTQKKFAQAKHAFKQVEPGRKKYQYYALSQFYLARIALFNDEKQQVNFYISQLQALSLDSVPFAIAFLNGERLFHQGLWQQASVEFQKALPQSNETQCTWKNDTLSYLGWSYLNAGKELNLPKRIKKATSVFQQLYESHSSDQNRLALAQALLAEITLNRSKMTDSSLTSSLRSKFFIPFLDSPEKENGQKEFVADDQDTSHATDRLQTLLAQDTQWKTRNSKHQSLIILTEAASSMAEKKQLLPQIVHESFSQSPFFPNAWYLKGLSELEEGLNLQQTLHQEKEASKYFDQALLSLQESFTLLYPQNLKFAALALKYQVYALYNQKTQEGLVNALSILSKILNQYRGDLFPEFDSPDEIYFLQGLIAAQLIDYKKDEEFFSVAENSLTHCIESYPKGDYQAQALHLLATLYYQRRNFLFSEKLFLELAKKTPPNSLTGSAWYWAAESAEKGGVEKQKVQEYWLRAYADFPNSPYADAAYFRYFDFRDYLEGNPDAIKHLTLMNDYFPHSPYQLNAHYLLGLEAKKTIMELNGSTRKKSDPSKAIDHFQKASQLYQQLLIPSSQLEYFTIVLYRSMIEQALTMIENSQKTQGIAILEQVYREFTQFNHPRSTLVKNSEKSNEIENESAYLLIENLLAENANHEASRVLSEVLEKYHLSKVTRGYYLSRTWRQRGILAARQGDLPFASQCFQHAEDAAKGKVLSTDELLELWIQQSLCYQKREMMDDAMLILSKVINYDAVSSQRLKAMYLRAKIYELQDRKELARRQLQAIANKGGPWALKAKEKLDQEYGYH